MQAHHLDLVAMHRTAYQWGGQFPTDPIDQQTRRAVIGAIHHDLCIAEKPWCIPLIQESLFRFQFQFRNDHAQAFGRHLHFERTDIQRTVKRLPYQVPGFHSIPVYHPKVPRLQRGKQGQDGGADGTGTDNRDSLRTRWNAHRSKVAMTRGKGSPS